MGNPRWKSSERGTKPVAGTKIDGPVSEAVRMINGRINELNRSALDTDQYRRDGMVEAVALIMIALTAPAPAAQAASSNGHTTTY